MCSIVEDDFGDDGGVHSMEANKKGNSYIEANGICNKCKIQNLVIKLEFRQPECKDCFQAYVRHKFRAALGSSKILPKDSNVLLIFDGSLESITFLDMMNFAQTQNTFKRLHCKTKVLLIDESELIPQITRNDIQETIEFLKKYEENFQSYIISIGNENHMPRSIQHFNDYTNETSDNNYFKTQLSNIKSLTSRQDFVRIYKKNLMENIAKQLECDFIFMPDISTNLASELLKNVCLGRGNSVALDVSLLDTRLKSVKIIRPLKDLTITEINFYIKINNLPSFKLINYGEDDNRDPSSSIQNLTKRFVQNLQQDYSSTVSTIFRVGEKITSKFEKNSSSNSSEICSFCNSNLDHNDSKTLTAMEVSRIACNFVGSNLNEINDDAKNAVQSKNLCHGCYQIQNDFVNKTNFLV